eukprot:TRINITY_DN3600_c0_g1_i1.p1 TRINITY_DN3600_c0_g1~~TRINITY_DN3600_c0_g1_i1.p1  ORF type:complete len:636 (+),score=152.31 TRINITY_DN3600_c0_g1_i1:25-1908(+)
MAVDNFTIFSKGGLVLWSHNEVDLVGNPINSLVKNILMEERGGENSYNIESYALKWVFANEFGIIFVAVYQRLLQMFYIDKLLELVKDRFLEIFKNLPPHKRDLPLDDKYFLPRYQEIISEIMQTKNRSQNVPRTFEETQKGSEISKSKKKKNKKKKSQDQDTKLIIKEDEELASEEDSGKEEEAEVEADTQNNKEGEVEVEAKPIPTKILPKAPGPRPKFVKRSSTKTVLSGPALLSNSKKSASLATVQTTKPTKVARVWDDKPLSKNEAVSLEKSFSTSGQAYPEKEEDLDRSSLTFEKIDQLDESSPEELETPEGPSVASRFSSWFSNLTNRTLTAEDLQPVLAQFKEHLIAKNVASEIAEKLCESVLVNLQGQTLNSFSRIRTLVQTSLAAALERILTPSKNIEILRDVKAVNEREDRPFTIVFVGVNGVGKSTNLAKVCYWLQENGNKVSIVACDTFRSGAIEQLQVHSKRLNVPLYNRGYGKDPAGVAKEGIRLAKDRGDNVVLIDTAGRMQDNLPLMQALAKLVQVNNPDLIVFVGEALVGNDAVDQLTKYNKSLIDLCSSNRVIDGIILTKFDTIDDKVGAALSMVYTTGSPILFLGTGQHYNSLKKMNVNAVVNALLR